MFYESSKLYIVAIYVLIKDYEGILNKVLIRKLKLGLLNPKPKLSNFIKTIYSILIIIYQANDKTKIRNRFFIKLFS